MRARFRLAAGIGSIPSGGLASIARTLDAMSVAEQGALRDRLRVGTHWDVEVIDRVEPGLLVSPIFSSALPVTYTRIPGARLDVRLVSYGEPDPELAQLVAAFR